MSSESKKENEEITGKVGMKMQEMLNEINRNVLMLKEDVEEDVKKAETMTKEHPGTALTVAFVAGLAVGGMLVLAAKKMKED
ncbi:MAG: hypothetical protein ABSB40_03900 [Nitrososphaeria archaeon]|jgi:ElaB/YqjD/DUF883 family membrane-anchored ribosome-binding protein